MTEHAGPQQLACGPNGLCELCYAAEARDNAPNLTGSHAGRRVCRRCGERVRHFIVRAKALETLLLESREGRKRYVATISGSARTSPEQRLSTSVVPSRERILRGLVTLNAAWRSAIPARAGAGDLSVSVSRPELTGLYGSLWRYKRSKRLLAALVEDNVLTECHLSLADQNMTAGPTAIERNPSCDTYSLGDHAPDELLKLLSDCSTLRVDAASILGRHLEDISETLFNQERRPTGS